VAHIRVAIVVVFLASAAAARGDGSATPQAVAASSDRVLYVAVPELPENLSPATAWTTAERQALDLLFSRLVQVRLDEPPGQRYESDLAIKLPQRDGLHQHVELRRDALWSDGERVTAADVRHTAQLLRSRSTWRDLLEMPRFDGRPFDLDFIFKHGLLDPYAPLGFYVLPQKYRGQALSRGDDAAFGKAPIGSGAYVYLGRKQEGNRAVAVFGANPFYNLSESKRGAVREIRMIAWKDVRSLSQQPQSHLILDVPERSLDALMQKGYAAVHGVVNRRVYFLAVNHRVAALANPDLRRALAHAIARDKILQDYFRGTGEAAKLDVPLSGPFPAHCWAWCPPPRVPDDPYQPELARSFAKKVGQTSRQLRLSLKYPADEPGVKEACAAISEQVTKVFADANVSIMLAFVPLGSHEMRATLQARDYELAYHHWDFADDNYWLWPLFDPHPDALRPGGSNFLGYDNDAKLQTLLRSVMSHRQFAAVRDIQQSIHAHLYERMPFIPLWQLSQTCAVHSSLSVPILDPQRPFANILDWRLSPTP
jgi:ABC-type transport system substrate-binding protein